ncbi:hypothetical protein DFH28DRAFT_910463 [Melampsora americana]|nr:hypothetical protein DFH28DRAFT_910463 [Melampsora americana]
MFNCKTCLSEQEHDPTELSSSSPGKLVQFLVKSEGYAKAGQACTETEVLSTF